MLEKTNVTIAVIDTNNKCQKCTASLCCTYITEQLETPRSKLDFEYLLWQISHENIIIYKDEDGWMLQIMNRCQHLVDPGGRCAIYDKRPQICRDHENDYCDFDQTDRDEGCDLYFDSYQSLRQYCKKRFKRWER